MDAEAPNAHRSGRVPALESFAARAGRATIVALCAAVVLLSRSRIASALDFPPSDFDILSADHHQLIGHGHYRLDQSAEAMTLYGENHYLDGEYDVEEDKLAPAGADALPALLSFRHDFFDASGRPTFSGRLDTATGLGSCGKPNSTGIQEFDSEQLKISPDSYAGSSVLIPIQNFVRQPNGASILKLHVFNCAPGPKLLAVDVKPEAKPQAWPQYPGELIRTDIQPNFGFWTLVIKPFIPKLAAWFDPSQNMLLVGAQIERYYKGAKIILVRKREAPLASPGKK